jgi:hypothetical protein
MKLNKSLPEIGSPAPSKESDIQFARLVPGQFFTIQYGDFEPPQFRLFYVKDQLPGNNKSLLVYELSSLKNRNALLHSLPLVESIYRHKTERILNVVDTKFGPDSSPGQKRSHSGDVTNKSKSKKE